MCSFRPPVFLSIAATCLYYVRKSLQCASNLTTQSILKQHTAGKGNFPGRVSCVAADQTTGGSAPGGGAKDLVHPGAIEGFLFLQGFCQGIQDRSVVAQEHVGKFFPLADDGGDLLVDD